MPALGPVSLLRPHAVWRTAWAPVQQGRRHAAGPGAAPGAARAPAPANVAPAAGHHSGRLWARQPRLRTPGAGAQSAAPPLARSSARRDHAPTKSRAQRPCAAVAAASASAPRAAMGPRPARFVFPPRLTPLLRYESACLRLLGFHYDVRTVLCLPHGPACAPHGGPGAPAWGGGTPLVRLTQPEHRPPRS
jgi:hypothetical protein